MIRVIGNNKLVDNKFQGLKEELLEYNWQYRKKICTRCIGTQQQKDRDCYTPKNGKVRIIDKKKIIETHCDWLENARTNKFRGRIDKLLNMATFSMFGKGGGYEI